MFTFIFIFIFLLFQSTIKFATCEPKQMIIQENKARYVAEIIEVNYNKCNYRPTKNEFYKTLITNLQISPCSGDTIIAGVSTTIAIYSKEGNNYKQYSRKQWIDGGMVSRPKNIATWTGVELDKDVRIIGRNNDFILVFGYSNGVGQLYIPLLHWEDNALIDNTAYMLRIYPDNTLYNLSTETMYDAAIKYPFNNNCNNFNLARNNILELNVTHIMTKMYNFGTSEIKDSLKNVGVDNINFDKKYTLLYRKENAKTTEEMCESQDIVLPTSGWGKFVETLANVLDWVGRIKDIIPV